MTRRLAVLALAVTLSSCAKCGGGGAKAGAVPLERLLPRGAVAVLAVPKLSQLGAALTQVETFKAAGFFAQRPQGFPNGRAVANALVGELLPASTCAAPRRSPRPASTRSAAWARRSW